MKEDVPLVDHGWDIHKAKQTTVHPSEGLVRTCASRISLFLQRVQRWALHFATPESCTLCIST